jgi:hypothetical protein
MSRAKEKSLRDDICDSLTMLIGYARVSTDDQDITLPH